MNMINNLFSIFDPSSSLYLTSNWISSFIFIIIIPSIFWTLPSRLFITIKLIYNKLHQEFKTILGLNFFKGRTIIFISLFLFILVNNVIGLFPYIFTRTSHLVLTLTLSLPLWLTFILIGWINNINHIFTHILPQGTPSLLIPFIVLIESISNVIRPGTLAVRLRANIIAGHLLITLLGNQTAEASNIILIILILTQILLLTLESAVAIIQSYVFAVLSTLYSREIHH